jgi:hypothetical protein
MTNMKTPFFPGRGRGKCGQSLNFFLPLLGEHVFTLLKEEIAELNPQ